MSSRFSFASLFLCFLTLVSVGRGENAADFPLAPAEEVHARGGLPNFFAKAAQPGSEIKVAYLGGSITAQAGYRVKSLAHFRTVFPQAKFSEINAAIGGTGSDLGVFRVKQDVLDQHPDLMFVEFAVNDGGAAPEQIFRTMEGIVRQTWKAEPKCDILFVYTVTEQLVGPMLEGKYPRAASAMEKVAEHYQIPSIHMGLEVAKLAKEGKLVWKAPLPKTDAEKAAVGDKFIFAADGVHPYPETGHELYLQAIVRSLDPIRAASAKPGSHELGAPLVANNYERAQMVPIGEATLSSGFVKLDPAKDAMAKSFPRLKDLHRGSKPGDTVTFKFKGTRAAIYDILGPDCGQVIVTLDDQAPKIVPRFDSYCTYARLGSFLIGTEMPDTVHTVKIEIHPDQPDKAKILATRNNKIDKPERFDGTNFYPGAILLVGEMVK
ncbi:MAG TPA: SGNH/GDSL hydrolase family protein [Chthoniobacter sp.]|jgi:lysophospholipase L1-like esterase